MRVLQLLGIPVVLFAVCSCDTVPSRSPLHELSGLEATPDPPAEGTWVAKGGVGFTSGPSTFLTGLAVDRQQSENLSLGGLLQIGVSNDDLIVAPSVTVKRSFDLREGGDLGSLSPYVLGGVGFAVIEKERPGLPDREDTGLLVQTGFGAEIPLEEGVSVGTGMLFNLLPRRVAGERFFFSWQLVTLSFRF
ncbi:MAG: hypothetical protein ACE5F1_12965 [Planctomycetota bacterium]